MKTINIVKISLLSLALLLLQTSCVIKDNGHPSAICSLHGSVPVGKKAFSPDGTIYACEMAGSGGRGMIAIYHLATDRLIKLLDVQQHPQDRPNDLKGLAWAPDSKRLGVLYHYEDGIGHICIIDVDTAQEKKLPIKKQYHCLEFSSDGTKINAEGEMLDIGSL